ncbi:phage protease [Limnobaculum xujianqingii]|uniref:phage protease n=1 Tax=Limnobaculum xujianqingii TaxID=2738837 RepID=UPI00112AA605|nr:phage protease [Limnobaculum xujianqingii]
MKLKIAALTFELQDAGNTIQLLPAGKFRATDGRPFECDDWFIDADIAASLIAKAQAKANRLPIDYEHQTLKSAQNGKPAPAAGWFKQMEWRDVVGLFAIDVDWTADAAKMIAAKEYRYISAVFIYDKTTGRVIEVLHAALTNTPALDGMEEVTLAAASYAAGYLADLSRNPQLNIEDTTAMEDLLEQLRWMLNLPLSATLEEVKAELQKLIDKLTDGAGTTAASVNLITLLQEKEQKITALSQQTTALASQVATLSTNVPQDVVIKLQHEVADLKADREKRAKDEMESAIVAALSDGRLTKALEPWARDTAKTNPDAVKSFLASAKPIASLNQMQTDGKDFAQSDKTYGLDADALAMCATLGVSPEEFAATMKGDA